MSELGRSAFKQFQERIYGNFRAKVEDNTDASQLGRIKARVYPWFSDIEIANIPYARPAMPLSVGSGTGTGSFMVPDIGSFVWVFFEAGDIYQPVYFAEAQTAVHGLPTERTTNYPNRRVLKTKSGITSYIDDTAKQIKVIHPEGSYIWFNTQGMITLYTTNDIKLDSSVVKVTGNMDIDTGWTGTFTTGDGKTVTVATGIIINVE